ncbi:surfeit locus protein 6-domain-containing protein [Schizothecium vesticola]|uniref:Surfeit locus protein 6-domain-containing protein n=1 Tax=Schizothecium vesticola TaxID=314040 RepID=A0AA40F248_9PEZI|nr:surfeit locus protein 6-domain-containing protein [Schizothecium vesticola]
MADSDLQERLRDYSHSFDSLMSLIPAKMYYGEEKSDQWKKKKQSKDQAKAAKMGKLDPDSELNRSAKEELEERARNKRKLRELEAEDEDNDGSGDDESDISVLAGIEREKPGEGLKKQKIKEAVEDDEPSPKKVKVDEDAQTEAATADPPNKKSSKEQKKEERKAAKKLKLAEKLDKLGVPKQTEPTPTPKKMSKEERKSAKKLRSEEKQKTTGDKTPSKPKAAEEDDDDDDTTTPHQLAAQPSTEADVEVEHDDDMAPIDVSGLADEDSAESTQDSSPNSPVFDAKNASAEPTSTTTSISSTVPPSEKPRYIKLPADTTALRVRLEAKLEALRAARKATGEEGQQVRTRSDLIEQRREKQIQRRAHKREMRLKAKEEEDRKREEALTSSRNSPMSMLSPMITHDADDSRTANHFAFGRLAFSDGTQMASDLSYQKTGAAGEKKGPSDPKTALAKLEAQKKRLAGLDEDKRKEVLEKETWLAARRRAEGEKVHDNENLLKKAVKRKEKAKAKSEAAWKERADGVGRAIKDKQRKREDNLKKRREEKGGKGKKKKGGVSKPKARPGFEGSFGGGGKRK